MKPEESSPAADGLRSQSSGPPEPGIENDQGESLLLPDGSEIPLETRTDREQTRQSEDDAYVPVIIKRTDETRRHPDDALETAIEEGLEQLSRPPLSLLLSAVAAGLIVGFSPMAVAVVQTTALEQELSPYLQRLSMAVVYPLGFIMCILSGAQLFTEHTATALYPVLDRKASVQSLLKLWFVVVVGNLAGAAISALLLYAGNDVIKAEIGFVAIGHHLVDFANQSLLVSATLAGWLMAMGAWLACSSPRTIAQITVIYIATFLIGLGGLHHSIAGSVEIFAALLFGTEFTVGQAIRFVSIALIGNLFGGSCFVALLNYAYIRRTNEP